MSLSKLRLAIAQLNVTVGDLNGNVDKIIHAVHAAKQMGAEVVLTPELSITGYSPEDLLLRPSFQRAVDKALWRLCKALSDVPVYVVVGHPALREGVLFNAASVWFKGQMLATYHKHDLPNREVFDEERYFTPDNRPSVFQVNGIALGLNICEDTWNPYAPDAARSAGAKVLLVPNASPFHQGKQNLRQQVVKSRILETDLAVIYANLVGGQDELVFDGGSFAMNPDEELALLMPQFTECIACVDITEHMDGTVSMAAVQAFSPPLPDVAQVYEALKLGVADYVNKNGFKGAIIGLSGGVDSALTLAIAVDALGADRVRCVMMPSPYTADISLDDARAMAQGLHVQYDELPIHACMQAFGDTLAPLFAGLNEDTTEENLQARIRGTLLMALSNKTGHIVLTTGNKSEMATGYCTLYGDMAGGFAVIKDIFKTQVYALCAYRNALHPLKPIIPERILTRAPSAELKPNQTDQDSLPPYEVLDAILTRYMENDEPVDALIAAGFKPEDVQQVLRLLRINEYKRRQAPIGIRVTHRAFGRDWRYPITSRFVDGPQQ